jgi:hypothetical protein
MPAEMLVYDRFAEERGWTPEQVRKLTRLELFWLPVVAAAKREAAAQVAASERKN